MRRRAAEKREVLPDPKFGDLVVTKFVNRAPATVFALKSFPQYLQ